MKFCNFPNCNNPVFGKGFCRNHQYKREDYDRRSIVQRAVDKHKTDLKAQQAPQFSKPTSLSIEKDIMGIKPVSMDIEGNLYTMDSFWAYAGSVIAANGSKCWECGDIISRSDYRNSTGHIFPKNIFESVKAHPYNFVVVGNRCGCHNKTHTLATFSQMSIFITAVNRYTKFCHLITENHKYHDLFLDYANQII